MLVDCALYHEGRRVATGPGLDALGVLDSDSEAFAWVGLRNPDAAELQAACDRLGITGIDVEEVLSPHTRPVLSVEGGTLHLVVRTARYIDSDETVSLGEITVLVIDRAILSVRHGHASPLSELRDQLQHEPEQLRRGPLAVLAAIVARVIADYRPALDGFEKDALEVEREVFSGGRMQPVRRLYALKREIRVLLHAIESLDEPLDRLIRHLGRTADPAIVEDLSEASDQLARTVSRAASLSNLLDAALTASLAQTGIQQNEDMRKISAWVAMAAVPTMVAGVYGMNFEHMPELESSWGYPAVLAAMAAVVAVMYRSFKHNDWL